MVKIIEAYHVSGYNPDATGPKLSKRERRKNIEWYEEALSRGQEEVRREVPFADGETLAIILGPGNKLKSPEELNRKLSRSLSEQARRSRLPKGHLGF